MDCNSIKLAIDSYLSSGAEKLRAELDRHLDGCSICRKKYAPLLNEADATGENGSETAEVKAPIPLDDDPADQFPDLSDPVEYKDAPITFTLILDGREEEIKMVEPQVDLPLPTGGRLVARENGERLTDVVFDFKPEKDLPYELHFAAKAGLADAKAHVMTYGYPPEHDRGLNSVFTEDIVERGGLKAWIEMTRGTARIYIRYAA